MTVTGVVLTICGAVSAWVGWSADRDGKHRQTAVFMSIAVSLFVLALVFNN